MNEKPLTQTISICISIKTKISDYNTFGNIHAQIIMEEKSNHKKLKKSNIACIMSLSCSLAFTKILAQQSQKQILSKVLHEIYKKTHEKNFKNPPKREDNDPFRNGCCMLEKWVPKELKRLH